MGITTTMKECLMKDFSYKKHSTGYIVKWGLLDAVSRTELKEIVYDVTKKDVIMCIDHEDCTFAITFDNRFFDNDHRAWRGMFVSSEQQAISILHLIDQARMWNTLKK